MTFSLEILRHIPVNIWDIGRGNERVKTVAGRLITYYKYYQKHITIYNLLEGTVPCHANIRKLKHRRF